MSSIAGEEYGYDLPKSALAGPGTTTASSIPDNIQEIFANVMWEPVPQVNIGLQYGYGFASLMNGPERQAEPARAGLPL